MLKQIEDAEARCLDAYVRGALAISGCPDGWLSDPPLSLALMAGVRNGFLPEVFDRKSGAQLRTRQSSARHLQAIGEVMQVAGSLFNNGHLECRAEVGK
jgi:hypothetical protein